MIHEALDAGITFIDTADGYSGGESEEILGKALAGGRRDDVVLATKFHSAMSDDPNHRGNSRRWIIREVENSLRRLNTDYIDLYQIHRPDSDTAIEQTLSALTDLVHQDRIRYIGSSSFTGSQIVEAQWPPANATWKPLVSEQPSYSILVRTIEEDVLPTAARHGIGSSLLQPDRRRLAVWTMAQRRRRHRPVTPSSRSDDLDLATVLEVAHLIGLTGGVEAICTSASVDLNGIGVPSGCAR